MKSYTILLFWILLHIATQGQTGEIINKADSLFENEDYFDAVTEYKRALYFNEDSSGYYHIHFSTAASYKAGGFYDKAVIYFGRALKYSGSKEESYTAFEQLLRCNILRHTPDNTISLINNAIKTGLYPGKEQELFYWKGWAYMFADNWDEASEAFSAIDSEHELKKFSEGVSSSKYDVTFAKVISYILPGSGQIYAGEYLSGTMSLGWTVLWGYVSVDAFSDGRVFDGFLTANLLWLRFYRGNNQNAEKFVVEKNRKIYTEALLYLQNNFEGIKP